MHPRQFAVHFLRQFLHNLIELSFLILGQFTVLWASLQTFTPANKSIQLAKQSRFQEFNGTPRRHTFLQTFTFCRTWHY